MLHGTEMICLVGGWTNPIWKILAKLDHFPRVRGEHKRSLEPPPSCLYIYHKSKTFMYRCKSSMHGAFGISVKKTRIELFSKALLLSVCLSLKTNIKKNLKKQVHWENYPVLHPGRLKWNLQITHLERKIIFQTYIIMIYYVPCSSSGVYLSVFCF